MCNQVIVTKRISLSYHQFVPIGKIEAEQRRVETADAFVPWRNNISLCGPIGCSLSIRPVIHVHRKLQRAGSNAQVATNPSVSGLYNQGSDSTWQPLMQSVHFSSGDGQ